MQKDDGLEDWIKLLLKRRNPDGGWGYYPGKSSWLEPTAYAAMALHGRQESADALALLRSWQAPSGAWLAQPKTGVESWATALVVALKCMRGEYDEQWRAGLAWLVKTEGRKGAPPTWMDRLLRREPVVDQDPNLAGWPWVAGTSNWVEPTAQALRALKLSRGHGGAGEAEGRIREGELLLLDRRCKDGGWNYGNKRVLEEDLPSFPECTGLALIGLSGNPRLDVGPSVERARSDWSKPQRGLAGVLLRIGLRMQGVPFEDRRPDISERSETTQVALAMIGEPEGAWRFWRGEAR